MTTKSKPVSPELMLKIFNRNLLYLLQKVVILKNVELENKLKEILRKTVIIDFLYDNYVIAISGLQGVGKSTLIKQFYDIPDKYIPMNIGRGEKLPILISEGNINNYRTSVKKLVRDECNDYRIKDEEVTLKDFIAIAKKPDENHVLLQLEVPFKHFRGINKSFLLLPGIEETNEWWSKLALHSLMYSTSCIFVFNENSLANEENENIFKLIEAQFEKIKPILALTFSDLSEDNNKGLKEEVAKRFFINSGEQDRIICTGVTEQLKEKWVPQFNLVLNKYCSSELAFRRKQVESLDELLNTDLVNVLDEVSDAIFQYKMENPIDELENISPILKYFRESRLELRNCYLADLTRDLDDYSSKPKNEILNHIANQGTWDKINNFFNNDLKSRLEFEKLIINTWENANGYGLEYMHLVTVNKIMRKKLGILNSIDRNEVAKSSKQQLIGNYNQKSEPDTEIFVDDEILDNLKVIFYPHAYKDLGLDLTPKFVKSVKAIPVIALELLRIGNVFPQLFKIDPVNGGLNKKNIEEVVNNFSFLRTQKGNMTHTRFVGHR